MASLLAPGPGSTPHGVSLLATRAPGGAGPSGVTPSLKLDGHDSFRFYPAGHAPMHGPTLFYPVVAPQSKTSFFPNAILPFIPFLLIQAPQILHDAFN